MSSLLTLQVNKLEQSDAERSEKEETAEEKPLVFGKQISVQYIVRSIMALKIYT